MNNKKEKTLANWVMQLPTHS